MHGVTWTAQIRPRPTTLRVPKRARLHLLHIKRGSWNARRLLDLQLLSLDPTLS